MNLAGWSEIIVTLGLILGFGWPLGLYLARVWQGERTWLDPVLKPVERVIYAICGVKRDSSQNWLGYARASWPSRPRASSSST
jgi:K+-transporting ATPase ATPase A chain